jgi:hypothetical protein
MKKLLLFSLVLVWAIAAPASSPMDPVVRLHFIGAERILSDTNSAAFTNYFCSAEAQAVRAQTLDKLSRALVRWGNGPEFTGAGAELLRPLLEDLLRAEWFLDVRSGPEGSLAFALALRLEAGRAAVWQDALAAVMEAQTKIAPQKIPGGWQWKRSPASNPLRFVRDGDGCVFSCEPDDGVLSKGAAAAVSAPGARSDWLSLEVDWPRLAKRFSARFPALSALDIPETRLRVVGRDGNLRLDGKIIAGEPFAFTLDSWRMPTNTIHQPVISFTALRGLAPWLQRQAWAQPYLISPAPNQVFFWALQGIPFQTYAAVPVPDASAALVQLHERAAAGPTNWHSQMALPMSMSLSDREITWVGLPFVAPHVQVVREASGDFLLGGLFPNAPRGKPLPPELLARLATANLVLYHWEITAQRLEMLLQPAQLTLMATRHKQFDTESAAGKWLNHVGPTLGNSTTEITQTAPNELTFTRRAPGGLTALELFALANWLDATNFPGCDLRLPPPRRVRNLPPSTKGASASVLPAPH